MPIGRPLTLPQCVKRGERTSTWQQRRNREARWAAGRGRQGRAGGARPVQRQRKAEHLRVDTADRPSNRAGGEARPSSIGDPDEPGRARVAMTLCTGGRARAQNALGRAWRTRPGPGPSQPARRREACRHPRRARPRARGQETARVLGHAEETGPDAQRRPAGQRAHATRSSGAALRPGSRAAIAVGVKQWSSPRAKKQRIRTPGPGAGLGRCWVNSTGASHPCKRELT